MPVKETIKSPQGDLFREELSNMIDLRHPLVQLSEKIDWVSCEEYFVSFYKHGGAGRPAHPIRLMVGLQLLKHSKNLSDEEVVSFWVENPYWQYFCGEQYFRYEMPIDPSLMTWFRQRIGESGCEFILGLTIQVGLSTKTVAKKSLEVVNVDTTVQEKAIAFPTDTRLLNKVRVALVHLAKKQGLKLRQSYKYVGEKAFVAAQRYVHARQMKRAGTYIRQLRTYLGRVIRDIGRQCILGNTQKTTSSIQRLLNIATRIHTQTQSPQRPKGSPPKVYSVHAPEVECITKGKVHKRHEFGVKVGIVSTNKDNFILGIQSLPNNPHDGHTLQPCLDQVKRITATHPKVVYADRGYRGHGCNTQTLKVWITGAKRGVTQAIQQKLKRRNAIEPVIGHLKSDGRLGRNFLKGIQGDAMNALLCGAGHNIRKILAKLRLLLLFLFYPQKLSPYQKAIGLFYQPLFLHPISLTIH
jgi:IS5 family transposase